MTVGIRIRGAAGNIQIDDTVPTLCVVEQGQLGSGNYVFNGQNKINNGIWQFGNRHNATFAKPYTGTAPPLVFLRFTNKTITSSMSCFTILGSPGNWTGFSVCLGTPGTVYASDSGDGSSDAYAQRSITPAVTIMDWFVAGYPSGVASSAKFGIRIRNRTTGALMFDSGFPLVKFLAQTSSFAYLGPVPNDAGAYYGVGMPRSDAYFLGNMHTGVVPINVTTSTNGGANFACIMSSPSYPNYLGFSVFIGTNYSAPLAYTFTALFAVPGN